MEFTLEEAEYCLKDEQERATREDIDEYTKGLLLNRCKMWEKTIAELKGKLTNDDDQGALARSC